VESKLFSIGTAARTAAPGVLMGWRRGLIGCLCAIILLGLLIPRLSVSSAAKSSSADTGELSPAEMQVLLSQLHAVEVAVPRKAVELAAVASARPDCIMFRTTGACLPEGPREPHNDKGCTAIIMTDMSGWCECSEGRQAALVGCGHPSLQCSTECAALPKLETLESVATTHSAPAAAAASVEELEAQLAQEESKMAALVRTKEVLRLSGVKPRSASEFPLDDREPAAHDDGEMSELMNHMMK